MSIPSITIRLDFGAADTSGADNVISVQGDAPAPTAFGTNVTSAAQTPAPTPTLAAGTMGNQQAAPTPMSAGGGNAGATPVAAPEPSVDMMGHGNSDASDVAPNPEGEPASVTKKSAKKK